MRDRVVEARVTGDAGEQRRLGRRRRASRRRCGRSRSGRPARRRRRRCRSRPCSGTRSGSGPSTSAARAARRAPPRAACARSCARPVDRVLHELLRDRRAALDRAAVVMSAQTRAHDAADVDAAVLVEALVLDRDDRVLRATARSSSDGDDDARLRPAEDREHRVPVARVDVRVLLLVLRLTRRIERPGSAPRSRRQQPER